MHKLFFTYGPITILIEEIQHAFHDVLLERRIPSAQISQSQHLSPLYTTNSSTGLHRILPYPPFPPLRNPTSTYLLPLINLLSRLIIKAIRPSDLLARPEAIGVIIMQCEERRRVQVCDVMFFGHVSRCPVSVVGDGDLMAVRIGEGGEKGQEGGDEERED